MPSLSDKLRALGVKVGVDPIDKPTHTVKADSTRSYLERELGGTWQTTDRGETFYVEHVYPTTHMHGSFPLTREKNLTVIANVANDPMLAEMTYEELVFLDTETSGLSGGTGTYAFMIGVGRFVQQSFVLRLYFMPDPSMEAAMLRGLSDFLAPCKALVTFNGKAFDAPLLRTRYALNNELCSFDGFAHIDLLTLSRRLWRARLPSRTLKYLEEAVLGVFRTSEEVPGYEIPWLYFDYLKFRDIEPLKGVFYHNTLDVVSMVTLLNLFNTVLEDPHGDGLTHGQDIIGLAKVFEDLGRWEDAARLYERGLQEHMPEDDFHAAVRRLAILRKRRGDLNLAERLWESAASEGHLYAHIELAKLYEHKYKNVSIALVWVERCEALLTTMALADYEADYWWQDIKKRQNRLRGKLNKHSPNPLNN